MEECDCHYCRYRLKRGKQQKDYMKEVFNLQNMANVYYDYGLKLLRAKKMILDGSFNQGRSSTVKLKEIPDDILYEIYEMQKIHNLTFFVSLPESLDSDEKLAYHKFSYANEQKGVGYNSDLIISEEDARFWAHLEIYLSKIISELQYFTFGEEKKAKNVWLIHKILEKHRNLDSEFAYSSDWVFKIPKIMNQEKDLSEDQIKLVEHIQNNPWMNFVKKHSDFTYILHTSPHLVVKYDYIE